MNAGDRFPAGHFNGRGEWCDHKGDRGDYETEFWIAEESDNTIIQTTRRHFFHNDGSFWYEENSQVIFTFSPGHFVDVAIKYGEATTTGRGYCFGGLCHFDLDVAADNHVESTYRFGDGKIELLGSATNKGNLTAWTEALRRVE